MVQHPKELGSAWLCCRIFFQDDTYLNLDLLLGLQDIWTFLWATLNFSVFHTHPTTPEKLKTIIWEQPATISQGQLQKAMCNLLSWVHKYIACDSGHLTDTVVKI